MRWLGLGLAIAGLLVAFRSVAVAVTGHHESASWHLSAVGLAVASLLLAVRRVRAIRRGTRLDPP